MQLINRELLCNIYVVRKHIQNIRTKQSNYNPYIDLMYLINDSNDMKTASI